MIEEILPHGVAIEGTREDLLDEPIFRRGGAGRPRRAVPMRRSEFVAARPAAAGTLGRLGRPPPGCWSWVDAEPHDVLPPGRWKRSPPTTSGP